MLFEVTVEIKPKDWIPYDGSEFQKGLLESLKNHVSAGLGRRRKTDEMSQIFMQKRPYCAFVFGGDELELSRWELLVYLLRKGSEQWAMGHPLHPRWFVKGGRARWGATVRKEAICCHTTACRTLNQHWSLCSCADPEEHEAFCQ